ncbi:MAG: LytTR family DNA-binding domain-containing protein [Flavobacterium sp.]
MNCIIIDDEEFSREITALLVSRVEKIKLLGSFSDAIDALKFINSSEEDIDLVLLDIHMPNFSGIDFIKTIKHPFQIILITFDSKFGSEAYNYDYVADYLIKPITEERFNKAMERVERKIKLTQKILVETDESAKDIYININKRLIKIEINTISYIKANGDYVLIKSDSENFIVHTTLKKIEQKLPKSIFVKTHRSYLVNKQRIIDIKDYTVLIGKEVIPIGKKNREELFKNINLLK